MASSEIDNRHWYRRKSECKITHGTNYSHFVIFILVISFIPASNARVSSETSNYGLTTYGEPCVDPCLNRGFPYAWCHKRASRNGTWPDRDYCSPAPGVTRYGEPCLGPCGAAPGGFHSCKTRRTTRGDWDYCSPFDRDACGWGAWGAWSQCDMTCGPNGRMRRQRQCLFEDTCLEGALETQECTGENRNCPGN